MRIKPCYGLDLYEEDFSKSGLLKMREIIELAAGRSFHMHEIEWPSPLLVFTLEALPAVKVIENE